MLSQKIVCANKKCNYEEPKFSIIGWVCLLTECHFPSWNHYDLMTASGLGFLIECRCGVVAGHDFRCFSVFASTHSHHSNFILLKNISISWTLSFRGNLGDFRKSSEWHVMTTECFHAEVCVLIRTPRSLLKKKKQPTFPSPSSQDSIWHFALFLWFIASWFTIMIFRLPSVLHVRPTQDKVMVSEIKHRNIKGCLCCFVFLLHLCFPLMEAFSEDFINWPVSVAPWGPRNYWLWLLWTLTEAWLPVFWVQLYLCVFLLIVEENTSDSLPHGFRVSFSPFILLFFWSHVYSAFGQFGARKSVFLEERCHLCHCCWL